MMTDTKNLKALNDEVKGVAAIGVTLGNALPSSLLLDNEFVQAARKSVEAHERERLEIMALGMTVQEYRNQQALARWQAYLKPFSDFNIEVKDG